MGLLSIFSGLLKKTQWHEKAFQKVRGYIIDSAGKIYGNNNLGHKLNDFQTEFSEGFHFVTDKKYSKTKDITKLVEIVAEAKSSMLLPQNAEEMFYRLGNVLATFRVLYNSGQIQLETKKSIFSKSNWKAWFVEMGIEEIIGEAFPDMATKRPIETYKKPGNLIDLDDERRKAKERAA